MYSSISSFLGINQQNFINKGFINKPHSLIKWDQTHKIIRSPDNITSSIPNFYADSDIEGKVSFDDFSPIFQSIDTFRSEKYIYRLTMMSTNDYENQCGLVREWVSGDSQLQFWISTDDSSSEIIWYSVYGNTETFLVVGNEHGHPFVITPTFSFYNSDGLTEDQDVDYLSLNINQIKTWIKSKSLEYVFHQIH